MIREIVAVLVLGIFIVLISSPSVSSGVGANESIWVNESSPTIVTSEKPHSLYDDDGIKGCIYEYATVSYSSSNRSPIRVCSVYGQSVDVASFVLSNGYKGIAVKSKADSTYHPLSDLTSSYQRFNFFAASDTLFIYDNSFHRSSPDSPFLSAYSDLLNSLDVEQSDVDGSIISYRLNASKSKNLFGYVMSGNNSPTYPKVMDYTVSSSGRYVVANILYRGYVALDMDNMEYRIMSNQAGSLYGGYDNPKLGAISNDGRYVFIDSLWRIYDISECGDDFVENAEEFTQSPYSMRSDCSFRDVSELIKSVTSLRVYGQNHIFNTDGTQISLSLLFIDSYDKDPLYIEINSNKLRADLGLKYLALGDSYSSGEGDIEPQTNGQSYYLPGTQGLGGCHVSSRSYPFLLAQYNVIKEDRMKSVACSGARLAKDYYGETGTYFGQTGQLKGQSTLEREAARSSALGDFTPGIVKQIEFIRAHKPKVVTLTGGGNDIGFGAIIKSCVYTVGIGNKTSTCEEVLSGSAKRVVIGDAIQTQFEEIKRFIKAIKSVSESTTIYVIGYPTFLADGPSTCVNSAALTQQEREGINDGVRFLNDVISSAAKSAGAKYVDIESSLSGGRLCEGSEYMTGVIDVTKGIETAQTFHPNYKGHREMAARIHGAGFALAAGDNPPASQTELPAKPGSFGSGQHVPTFQERLLADAAVVAGRAYPVTLATELGLTVRDKVRFTLYSKPADLGTYTVDIDGTLSTTLKIPANIPLGAHMLVADIISADGNVKRLYQYIEVRSKNPSDSDGDRIPNDLDTCPYIQSWIDERTGQDVCQIQKINGVLPGRGLGHGYGHVYSNGLHAGHEHDMSAIFKQ